MNIEQFVRENIKKLIPYSSARDESDSKGMIQLDANENPYDTDFNRYPDPYQRELKAVVSDLKGANPENLIIGNGSDEIIDLIIRTFCNPGRDNIVTIKPSYGMYKVSAAINDVELIEVELLEEFELDAEKVLKSISETTKIIMLCSPNNPTGNVLNKEEISTILNGFKGLVVIDEAYIDFAEETSWIESLNKYPQVIVLQTLSKSFGLAGLRLGLGWSSKEIISILNKVKPPYNVSTASQKAAISALAQIEDYHSKIKELNTQKKWLEAALDQISLVEKRYNSEANFILIKVKDATALYDYLVTRGVVVRNRTSQFGCTNCLRITVGLEKENKKIIELLKNYK